MVSDTINSQRWLDVASSPELSQQFLVEVLFGLRASSVEILGFAVLVLLRTVLESIRDNGDLVSVADLTVIDNQTCETLQLIVDYKLASKSMDL